VTAGMRAGMAVLAAACVGIGVAPGFVLRPLGATVQLLVRGSVVPDEAASIAGIIPWVGLVVLAVLGAAWLAGRRRSVARLTPTWACGLPGLNSRMQYTSTAFSKPLRKVFSRAYRPDRTVEVRPAGETYFPAEISYHSVRTTSYERKLYRPLVEAIVGSARRVRRLQTGNIQVYLLYIFLALIGVLAFMRFA